MFVEICSIFYYRKVITLLHNFIKNMHLNHIEFYVSLRLIPLQESIFFSLVFNEWEKHLSLMSKVETCTNGSGFLLISGDNGYLSNPKSTFCTGIKVVSSTQNPTGKNMVSR